MLSAVNGGNLMISGGTRIGKTELSWPTLQALFGDEETAFLQVDASLDMNKLRDINFEVLRSGKTLADASLETKFIAGSAALVDEINRAIAEQTSILHGWLVNGRFVVEGGRSFDPGKVIDTINGKTIDMPFRYHFKVATLNEGNGYIGTKQMDAAARSRFAVELNLNTFPAQRRGSLRMLTTGKFRASK